MIPDHLKISLEERVTHAVSAREAAVDLMKVLQSHYGWLTDEAVDEAAQLLGLSTLQVEELATFYEMIYRRPVGQVVILVCDSVSCWAMGGETLLQHLEKLLGVEVGGTTEDNLFTLLPCSCLGNCGDAPAIMVGEQQHGRMTAELVVEIIKAEQSVKRHE